LFLWIETINNYQETGTMNMKFLVCRQMISLRPASRLLKEGTSKEKHMVEVEVQELSKGMQLK
jgi:hypothetical protein